jgi:hypothetical protein
LRFRKASFSIPVTGDTFFARGTCLAPNNTSLKSGEGSDYRDQTQGIDLFQGESSWWWVVTALALFELVALFLMCLGSLRRRRWLTGANRGSVVVPSRRHSEGVSREVERLCAGEDPSERYIKQMSAEERALFEVSLIDALNSTTRERQHRLRSALIKCGYDELCARRVMSEDLADRVRATALLTLLRPQWRKTHIDPEQRPSDEGMLRVCAATRVTGPLDMT